jgi:peptidoglycan/xylan/chitin deacetylase (PgdA/CDA1 family)
MPNPPQMTPSEGARRARARHLLPLVVVAALIAVVGVLAGTEASRGPARSAVATLPSGTPSPRSTRARPHDRHGRPVAVPILMYHHVAPRPGGSPLLWVTTRQLVAELAFLRRRGYHTVTLQQVYRCWTEGTALPARPVVLSFDDGYVDQYRYAAPLLRRFGDVGVLDLIVDNLGRALTVGDVLRMSSWGWEIDSHTITHRDLTRLPRIRVRYELVGSRDLLRRYLRLPIDFFCYPGGAYDAAVRRQVSEAGYLAATSVDYGLARPAELYALPRIVVFGGEPVGLFAESLSGSPAAGWAIDRAVARETAR